MDIKSSGSSAVGLIYLGNPNRNVIDPPSREASNFNGDFFKVIGKDCPTIKQNANINKIFIYIGNSLYILLLF